MNGSRSTSILIHEVVTGGGHAGLDLPESLALEGRAMRRALVDDFASVPGVTVLEVGPGDQATLDRLIREVDCILIVAPETGGELENHALWVAGVCVTPRAPATPDTARWIGSSPDAIALTADKSRLAAHFRTLGIATPPTIEAGWDGPVVVKPVDGAGSVDTSLFRDFGLIPLEIRRNSKMMIQPYRPGTAMSASYLVDVTGKRTLIAVGQQRVVIDRDKFTYLGGLIPEPIDVPDCVDRAVASVPGLLGFVGVDFLMDDGRAEVLEINPRPTTSIVGLTAILPSGTIAGAWLAACSGALKGTEWPDRLGAARTARPVRFDADGTIVREDLST